MSKKESIKLLAMFLTSKSSDNLVKHNFYFYTGIGMVNDSVRIQQKRILGYSTTETVIIDLLWKSVFAKKICNKHERSWHDEWCKVNNFLNEFQRQKSIELENRKNGKICIICDSSKGTLYETTDEGYIHSECVKGSRK